MDTNLEVMLVCESGKDPNIFTLKPNDFALLYNSGTEKYLVLKGLRLKSDQSLFVVQIIKCPFFDRILFASKKNLSMSDK
mgnify:CR=1 FL=1